MKYIVLFFLSINLLFSAEIPKEINKVETYQEAIELAKEENKKVLVMMTTRVCPWCNRAKKNTLTNEDVYKYINKNFVFVEVDRDRDKEHYPEDLYSRMVPTFSIVEPKKGELMYQVIGYRPPKKFLKEIDLTSMEEL